MREKPVGGVEGMGREESLGPEGEGILRDASLGSDWFARAGSNCCCCF